MSPLAYALYGVSFVIIIGCAWLVFRYAAGEFVDWRSGARDDRPEGDPRPRPRHDGTPVYAQLCADRPVEAGAVARARRDRQHRHLWDAHRRNIGIVNITFDTRPFREAMLRAGESMRRMNADLVRIREEINRGGTSEATDE